MIVHITIENSLLVMSYYTGYSVNSSSGKSILFFKCVSFIIVFLYLPVHFTLLTIKDYVLEISSEIVKHLVDVHICKNFRKPFKG